MQLRSYSQIHSAFESGERIHQVAEVVGTLWANNCLSVGSTHFWIYEPFFENFSLENKPFWKFGLFTKILKFSVISPNRCKSGMPINISLSNIPKFKYFPSTFRRTIVFFPSERKSPVYSSAHRYSTIAAVKQLPGRKRSTASRRWPPVAERKEEQASSYLPSNKII